MSSGKSRSRSRKRACGRVVGGWMADLFGYSVVFGASLGFLAAAFLILLVAVREPRHRRLA